MILGVFNIPYLAVFERTFYRGREKLYPSASFIPESREKEREREKQLWTALKCLGELESSVDVSRLAVASTCCLEHLSEDSTRKRKNLPARSLVPPPWIFSFLLFFFSISLSPSFLVPVYIFLSQAAIILCITDARVSRLSSASRLCSIHSRGDPCRHLRSFPLILSARRRWRPIHHDYYPPPRRHGLYVHLNCEFA